MDRMSSARPDGFRPVSSEEVRRKKTSFTLDFASNAAAQQSDVIAAKRAKQELLNEGILRSPDVSLLALATPDLERLIMQQAYGASAAVATTPPGAGAANPSIVTTPTQVLFPRSVTEEQEAYARGFIDALLELQRQQQQKGTSSPHLQVVPDPRTGFLLPLTSPSEEGQASLYTTLTSLPRGPQQLPEGTTSKLSLQAMPLSVLRPANLSLSDALSPVIRRSAIVPTLGAKPFPPFVNDSETLDLSPSGRFPTKSMEHSVKNDKRTMQALLATSTTSVLEIEQSCDGGAPLDVDIGSESPAQQQIGECHSTELVRLPGDTVETMSSQLSKVPALKESPPFSNVGLPIQPIDMSIQELAKIERKREKNRYAAQKCRQLKLERIERLEKRIAELKQQNETLTSASSGLRDHVNQLKQLVVQHVEGGCQIMTVHSLQTT